MADLKLTIRRIQRNQRVGALPEEIVKSEINQKSGDGAEYGEEAFPLFSADETPDHSQKTVNGHDQSEAAPRRADELVAIRVAAKEGSRKKIRYAPDRPVIPDGPDHQAGNQGQRAQYPGVDSGQRVSQSRMRSALIRAVRGNHHLNYTGG